MAFASEGGDQPLQIQESGIKEGEFQRQLDFLGHYAQLNTRILVGFQVCFKQIDYSQKKAKFEHWLLQSYLPLQLLA